MKREPSNKPFRLRRPPSERGRKSRLPRWRDSAFLQSHAAWITAFGRWRFVRILELLCVVIILVLVAAPYLKAIFDAGLRILHDPLGIGGSPGAPPPAR